MKRKVAKLRLSPNEEARIIREEHERRRKLRIQQVRDQQRYIALQIRQAVEQRRQHELEQLAEELRRDWEQQQREKMDTLLGLYQNSLQLLGQGHRSAKENEPDLAAIAQREEENHTKAEERYREALKDLKSQRLKEHERQSRFINARRKALQTEKERSAKVASLPPPPPNPVQQDIDSRKPHLIKKSDVSAFAGTHYHISESTVDRDLNTQQFNAHEEAEFEVKRLQDLQKEEKRKREEQLEKARLRGKQALRREQLVQDRERFLIELEHMQQTDFLRRRQQVSQMPPQIFLPLYKRQETREDFQRQMEFAFEDMYTGERRVNGDLVVQLVPEPLPALSTGSQDQELDISIDEIKHDSGQEVANVEQETSLQAEFSKPAPRQAFKKLLDRINSQRRQWADRSSCVPSANSPTAFSDQIPQRDVSIETGSLISEGDKLPASARSQPEQSRAAEHLLPDVTDTIQDEYKKRAQVFLSFSTLNDTKELNVKKQEEDVLEREKQNQMILLQELEEQKVTLEQMLLEAQQERECLKAAVTQEEPINQPDVCDQEIISITPGPSTELESPSCEDEHSRRIREYQQHILEQNRIHQRSVEVARQRLEEYQRALRVRHSLSSISMQPAVVPLGLSHPPLRSESAHLPAVVQLPTAPIEPPYPHAKLKASVEAFTKKSDSLALLPDSSLSVASKFQQDEVKSLTLRSQRADRTWLTDNITERIMEHLPESVRLSPPTPGSLPYKSPIGHQSASIPVQQVSDPSRATSPSVTDDAPTLSGTAVGKPRTLSHGSLQTGSLSSRGGDMERQRLELQGIRRWLLDPREALTLRQTQEEKQQKQDLEMEQMRQQKETLQALIQTDMQPVPEVLTEVFPVPEKIGQTRLRLLVSLLKAIEESNGGTLSHLEDPQEKDGSPHQLPSNCDKTGPLPPPRAVKPPVTRVRLGLMERMTKQHELSAIQEVETPVDTSQVTGPEDWEDAPSHTVDWDLQELSDPSQTSNRTLLIPSLFSKGQQDAERPADSGTNSRGSGHLIWRERLLIVAESDSAQRVGSPLSSNFERGADNSGPVLPHKSPIQSPHRPPDSDCLSSTTISTGSYITTDPENNEKSPLVHLCGEQGHAADVLDVSSPSSQSSAAGCPGVAVNSLFRDSTIQHIIDRYTRELNISLSTAGRSTDREASNVEEPGSSLSQQCWVQSSDGTRGQEGSAGQPCLSGVPGTQTGDQERDNTVTPVVEHPEQDSFRPLIAQLMEQSSCLAAHHRELATDQMVGHPWAHSSMIGHPTEVPGSVSLDQGGWESSLSRMIGRLSHRPSFHWMSGGQDFYAGQVMEQSTTWLDDGQDEGLMRPLVGELDNDESSGENTHADVGVSTEASLLSCPALPPDALSHESPHTEEQTLQNQTSPVDVGPETTEVFPGLDLFHPLLAEITHNETADPSMTFHLLQHNLPTSTEEQATVVGCSVSTETQSDLSLEHLRVERSASHDSSQSSQESVLVLEDTIKTDVELPALSLSYLSSCDDAATQSVSQPGGGTVETNLRPNGSPDLVPFNDPCAEKRNSESPVHCRLSPIATEVVNEKGILEQSEIMLVNLTDSTLQDPETATADEEGMWDDNPPDGGREDRQKGQDTESLQASQSTLRAEHRDHTPPPVKFLEIQWGVSKDLQEVQHHNVQHKKLRALLQRSSQRMEDIRARRTLLKVQPEIQAPCEAEEPASYKAKTKPEPQHKTNRSKGAGAVQSAFIKPQPPSPVRGCRQKGDDEVSQIPGQRKRDLYEMFQRTQRLYEQLEEVKQQKNVRSRQEASAKNRLKAKEFHKKTLQKLRAKQMLQ